MHVLLPKYVRVHVRSSVCIQAFSFVKNNSCTLEFVNHLGNLRGVSMDFYTFRYRCCFRRTLMCKKVRKKNYKLLLNPCMSVRLSAFSSQNRV